MDRWKLDLCREDSRRQSAFFEAQKQIRNTPMIPKQIRTYLIVNIVFAVVMVVFMAMETHLVLLLFLAALIVVPVALVEIYLYPKKKGIWYELKQGPRRPAPDFAAVPGELVRRKSEAFRARLASGEESIKSHEDRTTLFESNPGDGPVSRAALQLNVAVKLEQSGKREAAETCYRQIIERFADSLPAREAARRLASMART
jgi:hypothetical protein